MRLAVISDVHGNLPALEAVLADVKSRGVELLALEYDWASASARALANGRPEWACALSTGAV
jgi:predicted phosphodiesterase